jgi:glycosyltransferase involved in cell wall biosynthesis
MSSKLQNIVIIADSQINSDSLSGSDRIFIELAKHWSKIGHNICVITCEEGYSMCQRYGLKDVDYIIASARHNLPVYLAYFFRIFKGIAFPLRKVNFEKAVIYSSSDFWPDSLPAWIFKMRFRSVKWIAGFYLFAPSPFGNGSPYKGFRRLRGLFYYLSQLPAYALIRRYADMVWVTSEPDKWRFIDNRLSPSKVIAVQGGVDTKTPALIQEPKKKKFDAVFIGRFHPQKGVLELIDIWKYVCDKKKDAKLAMIGVGEFENEVKERIQKYGLEDKVILFGFRDGVEKIKIFKDSKIVVHPAIYDSGGMAACEAMACGLPGVSFDLPALRTYYPKGMLKTPCYDVKRFAEEILKLLDDGELYGKTAKDALSWAQEWDWDKRAEELLRIVQDSFLKND